MGYIFVFVPDLKDLVLVF